ncbi:MAG: RDD family protein [Bacilli bacterium]|nr:RDD family protein [Bacilli bacterium]
MVKSKKESALLIQRVIAYIIDGMIIALVATLISFPFYDATNMEKLNKSSSDLAEKYMNKKINSKTYISENIDINYEVSRKSGVVSLVTIFLEVLYFVCYQLYTKGQTLGKKLMKIRIIDKDDNNLGMNQLIYRSLIINSIFINLIIMCLVIFADKNVSFYGTMTLNLVQYIIMFVSAIMVIFTKESIGLHDKICNTRVIREKTKELKA